MFNPTHTLISRSRNIPVMLKPGNNQFLIFTAPEWHQQKQPAFTVHPKLGIYCRGIQVVGYHLEPIKQSPIEPEPPATVPVSA